ncbi:hypothetical protein, partial [Pseudomonas aeruginosa]|nr:hypothetical protein [Pseudomonas aeruginosa]
YFRQRPPAGSYLAALSAQPPG